MFAYTSGAPCPAYLSDRCVRNFHKFGVLIFCAIEGAQLLIGFLHCLRTAHCIWQSEPNARCQRENYSFRWVLSGKVLSETSS